MDLPFPEPLEALDRQLAWLRAGRKSGVLVPHCQPVSELPWAEGLGWVDTPHGRVYYARRPDELDDATDRAVIRNMAADDNLGWLLGYFGPRKPAKPIGCAVLRDAGGVELWAHLVSAESLEPSMELLRGLAAEGDRVSFESAEQVAAGRCEYWLRRVSPVAVG